MTGIFQKGRTVFFATIHSLLDKAIDLNKIGAIEQYVRDLSAARDKLDDEAAGHRSDAKTLPREIATLKARQQEADANITALLSDNDPTNDHLAAPLEAKLEQLERQVKLKEEALTTAQAMVAKFDEAVQKLDLRLADMNGRLETLRQMEQTTNVQERTAKLLSGVSLSSVPNTDDVEQRLRRQADVAANRLDRELGRVTGAAADQSLEATVTARLAKRRQAIEAAKATPAAAETAKK